MPTPPDDAQSKEHLSEQSETDEPQDSPAVESTRERSRALVLRLSTHDQGSLDTEPLNTRSQKPCPVCLDLEFPAKGYDEEWEAYMPFFKDQKGDFEVDGYVPVLYKKLKATAEAGCPSCGLLREIWKRLSQDEALLVQDEHCKFHIIALKDRVSQSNVFNIWSSRSASGQMVDVVFHRGLGDEATSSLAKKISPLAWITSRPTPSDVKGFVELHLNECLSPASHPNCPASTKDPKTSYLPKRLIAVLDDKGSALDPLLVETASFLPTASNDPRYIALSHCWGSPETLPINTTLDNYDDHLRSIPWDALSKTFQDAILVARVLGVRFLWIDSLCIIQDDQDDWARESSTMAGLYENAWLTIAATSAQDGTQGLLMDRPGVKKVQAPHGDFSVFCRPTLDHSELFLPFSDGDPARLPLLTRGWAFQEQILSTRILHFTQEELIWECRSGTFCECSPEALGGRRDFDYSSGLNYRFSPSKNLGMDEWRQLVQAYMHRHLTYTSDNLPALSGIATAFQQAHVNPGRYLAGLWENDLIRGLLWHLKKQGSRSSPSHMSSPPSWSWASMERCTLTWEVFPVSEVMAEVIDSSCNLSTVDEKGMVLGGQVTLRGQLIPLLVQSQSEEEDRFACELYPKKGSNKHWRRNKKEFNLWPDVLLSSLDESLRSRFDIPLYLLPLVRSDIKSSTVLRGILLRQLPGFSKSAAEGNADTISSLIFERVGAGKLYLNRNPDEPDPYPHLGDGWDTTVKIE